MLSKISQFLDSLGRFTKDVAKSERRTRVAISILVITLFFVALIYLFKDQTGWVPLVAFVCFLIASASIAIGYFKPTKKHDYIMLPTNPDSKETRTLHQKRGDYYVPREVVAKRQHDENET